MALHITEECVNCNACEDSCPNTAISPGPEIFVIDPTQCTECVGFNGGPACAEACPVDCCLPDPDRVETEVDLIDRARRLHPGKLDDVELTAKNSHFR